MPGKVYSKAFTDAYSRRDANTQYQKGKLGRSVETAKLLQSLVDGEVMLLVSTDDNGDLMQVLLPILEVQERESEVQVLSYRWDDFANAFAKKTDWEAMLWELSLSPQCPIAKPQDVFALAFYNNLKFLLCRSHVKYLWVDQLSIPQDRSETMEIVHASGPFYRTFKVLVWTPWAVLTDSEIQAEIQNSRVCSGPKSKRAVREICRKISFLYDQMKRGWILREVCSLCQQSDDERQRNNQVLEEMVEVLEEHIKQAFSTSADEVERERLVHTRTEAKWLLDDLNRMVGAQSMTADDQILHAARITFAQFSVPSDRELVAKLDDFSLATCATQHVRDSGSQAPSPYSEFLKMLMFVATGGFFKEGGYRAFSGLPYPDQGCRQILEWIFATTGEMRVTYTPTQWARFEERLRAQHTFTGFLPKEEELPDLSLLSPFSSSSSSEAVGLSVKSTGIQMFSSSTFKRSLQPGKLPNGEVVSVEAEPCWLTFADVLSSRGTELLVTAFKDPASPVFITGSVTELLQVQSQTTLNSSADG